MTPPRASFAEPTVWFHEPVARLGSSLATPEAETVAPGSLTAAWEASCSVEALSCLASPSTLSLVLPVTEPITLCTVPVTESATALRVEVLSLEDIVSSKRQSLVLFGVWALVGCVSADWVGD